MTLAADSNRAITSYVFDICLENEYLNKSQDQIEYTLIGYNYRYFTDPYDTLFH